MDQFFVEPTMQSFLFQAIALTIYIPVSYIAYLLRARQKHKRVEQSLEKLGVRPEELEGLWGKTKGGEYRPREYRWWHYVLPLLMAWALMFVSYSMVHPYVIQRGLWSGCLEEVIDIFRAADLFPRIILAARFLFWGWLGAWIYSLHLTFRRFLAYDLTPSVYIFAANRFLLALTLGSIVGTWIGTSSAALGRSFNANMATVSAIAFGLGFFPEWAITWIAATLRKGLKRQGGVTKETRLSEIEGLSIWHQSRLKQEGIENVQNLATADLPVLVVRTPYTVKQLVDWVDQAILLVYARQEEGEGQEKDLYATLERVGLRGASDVLAAAEGNRLDQLARATGLEKDGEKDVLRMLRLALQSAPNIEIVSYFRWQSSVDPARRKKAEALRPLLTSPVKGEGDTPLAAGEVVRLPGDAAGEL